MSGEGDSSKLTVVADMKVKADQVEVVKSELMKLVPITLAEEGCLQYDLHQDNKEPTHFLIFENWASKELWEKHMANQHLKDFVANTEGMLEVFNVSEMTKQ
mmetsp:Transcript_20392/g.37907  ORF Transcript_20392/g.37907 Transcript_20392/m.37907 type:complete len:102 (+) Transcript_20392:62-367(+)